MPGRSNAYTSSPSVSQTSSGGVRAWLESAAARAGDSSRVWISRSNSPFLATFRSGSRKRTRVVIELVAYQFGLFEPDQGLEACGLACASARALPGRFGPIELPAVPRRLRFGVS